MDDEISSDLQKCLSEGVMDTDEGPLINENSNGLSHLLTEGEFNSVEAVGMYSAVGVDESSASNQGFLNSTELSTGSVGDYLESNTDGFNAAFDTGDNAVNFPTDTMNSVLSDGDSRLSDNAYRNTVSDIEGDADNIKNNTESNQGTDTSEKDDKPGKFTRMEQEVIELSNDNTNSEAGDKAGDFTKMERDMIELSNDNEVSEVSACSFTKIDHDVSELSNHMNTEVSIGNSAQEVHTDNMKLNENSNDKKDIAIDTDNYFSNQFRKGENSLVANAETKKTTDLSTGERAGLEENKPPQESKTETTEIGGAEEIVSEDELPVVQKPSVKDAENVSDDELPGPRPADLPADTEVVSEDELPSSKKESRKRKPDEDNTGYDPGSPTNEQESSNKKQALAKNGESKPISSEKRPSTEDKLGKKKGLPELDKYWKVVNDDPTDFTGWTYLLQYVDQESDVDAAREAYDAFLSHYPYCYGYWRKYADYEKRKGSKKKCLELDDGNDVRKAKSPVPIGEIDYNPIDFVLVVLERGLKAIPLSVDLWIHYLNHIKATRTEDLEHIRSQYERAVDACGLEFRSDRLWESYIKWESENGSALNVTNIYDRLLATPTLGYTSHFDNFQEHVMSSGVVGAVSAEELVRLRGEVRLAAPAAPLDLPPGEDEPTDHLASEEEGQAIKERIIAARRKVHKTTGEQVAARWTFEERIKRPYFHVKPLERCQLKNWKAYLEWEKNNGTLKRTLVLYERCLIACALYEEFWMRLVRFLEERSETDPKLIPVQREVLERACTVHHLDKPDLHLHWAQFEELHGNPARAADILDRIEKTCPNLMQIQYRRVNLERRRGDYDKCSQLYESYIAGAKNKAVASALAIKYARFLFHLRQDRPAARKVLDDAIAKDPLNQRLYLQRVDLALNTPDTKYEELEELLLSYEKQEGAELEAVAQLAWRARELAEERGEARHAAAAAAAAARALLAHRARAKRARRDKHDQPPPPLAATGAGDGKKKESCPNSGSSASNATGASQNSYSYPTAGTGYDQYPPYQPPWGYQQPQYHPPWPQYPNYY